MFSDVLLERESPREDCVKVLPDVPRVSEFYLAQEMSSEINSL